MLSIFSDYPLPADVAVVPTEDAPPAEDRAVRRTEETLDGLAGLVRNLASSDRATAPVARDEWPAGFRLSVVIPVFNEAATILNVIEQVRAVPLPAEVIVVDDCSTDGTRDALERLRGTEGLQLILKPRNEGKGAAVRDGFRAATGDVVVVQDADLEYDPRDLPALVRPIVQGEADVVFGSRFLDHEPQDRSLPHRLVNRVLTQCSNWFTGLRLTDMETCYKVVRRDLLRELPLRQDRFGFEPEVTAKLARRTRRVVERPVRYRPRGYTEGKKIGVRDAFNAVYCIVRYGLAD